MSLLKQYASFIKNNYLNEITAVYLSYITELNIPLLKFFAHLTHEQLLEASRKGINDLLENIENDKAIEAVKLSLQNWEEDKMEGLSKEDIQPSDLILVYAAQEMALVEFIDKFTSDGSTVIQVTILLKQFFSEAQKLGFDVLFKIREESEAMLRESEERFRSFSQTAADGIIIVNEDRDIIFWNNGAEKIFGFKSDEIIGTKVRKLIPERYLPLKNEIVEALTSGKKDTMGPLEFHMYSKTGKEIPVELSSSTWETRVGKYFSYIIHDIRDRVKIEQELRASNQELEQFAYVASHDLKEPLRMVSNYLQLLDIKHAKELSTDARTYIDFAVEGARRMDGLINAILNYSRINSRKEPFTNVNTEKVIQDVENNLSEVIKEKNAEIIYDKLPVICGDLVQITQLFQNLVANGIKFSERKPVINIKATERKDHKWLFSISDTGIGIDKSYSDKIFVMFQRLNDRKEFDGTGMGLAISKKIVEKHGGEIWFESEKGEGTAFYFTLEAV